MTWTYSGDPAANARDSIRFLVGDTDTNDQLVSDEEIAWTNSEVTGSGTATTDLYTVAYRVMLAIASKFSRLANQQVGDMRVDLSQKADNARRQAEELRTLEQPASVNGDVLVDYKVYIPDRTIAIDTGDQITLPAPVSGTRPIVGVETLADPTGQVGQIVYVGRTRG